MSAASSTSQLYAFGTDPALLEELQEVCATLGCAISPLREEEEPGEPGVIVVFGSGAPHLPAFLREDQCASTHLLLVRSAQRVQLAQLVEGGVSNLVAHNLTLPGRQDLKVTLQKLIEGKIFGADRYLSREARQERFTLRNSGEKGRIAEAGEQFASRCDGLSSRLVQNFRLAVDELVTNALFNAPVDGTGAPRYRGLRRDASVALEGGESLEVGFFHDGARLAVSVKDPFGSLTAEQVRAYLARCFNSAEPMSDGGSGGAGLGLFYVFDAMNHLVINIAKKRCTEVIGIMDVVKLYREFAGRPKSFNIFTERA